MKPPFDHRMQRIETTVQHERDAHDASEAFDPDPAHYRLIVCRVFVPEQEPVEQALGRWGLVRGDIAQGIFVYLAPCYGRHVHRPPLLLCNRPTGPSKGDHERLLDAALAQSEDKREQQRQARWEQDRETLRRLKQPA